MSSPQSSSSSDQQPEQPQEQPVQVKSKQESKSKSKSKSRSKSPVKSKSRDRSRERNRKKRRESHSPGSNKKNKRIINLPDLSGQLVPLNAFISKQDRNIDQSKLEDYYTTYKKDWTRHQDQLFFIQHKNDCWFQEKYNTEWKKEIEKERSAMVQILAEIFFKDYEQGKFKNINFNVTKQQISAITDFDHLVGDDMDVAVKPHISLFDSPYFALNPDQNTYFIKNIPKNISRFDILEEVKKIPGFFSLSMTEPLKRSEYQRHAWIVFEQQSFENASVLLNGLIIKQTLLTITKSVSKQRRIKVIKHYSNGRIDLDCKTSNDLIKTLDEQQGIKQNPLLNRPASSQQFDLNILYLRRVHAYDYFGSIGFTPQQYNDERGLINKNGLLYLRIGFSGSDQYGISSAIKRTQKNALQRAENKRSKENYDELVNNAINDALEDSIHKGACKCKECAKKFSTIEYLSKHIINKHPQLMEKMKQDAISKLMKSSYSGDKYKITDYPQSTRDRDRDRDRGDREDDDRRQFKGRSRPGGNYRKPFQYQDLDNPVNNMPTESKGKTMVNFLDI